MKPELLNNVTTPLALAALCLMLGTGLLKVISKAKPNPALQLSIHWGFILALTLGVLANVSFVFMAGFGREIRIAGTVRDDSGKPVSRAIVDVAGRGRGITDDYGGFEFSIPDSRKANEYEVVVSLAGHSPERRTLQGPRPDTMVSVTLKRQVLKAEELIGKPDSLMISHYLGMPQMDVSLSFQNPLPEKIRLENIAVSVVSPDGQTMALPMQGTYAPMGNQFVHGAMRVLELDKDRPWKLGYSFYAGDQGVNPLLNRVQTEVSVITSTPAPGQRILSQSLAKELEEFMERKLIWKAGEWRLTVEAAVEGRIHARSFRFNLAPDDVARMKALARYYPTGAGVLPVVRLPQFADATASVTVTLRQ